MFISLVLWCLL